MTTDKKLPRGIRNNNPGNIRWGDEWQGLVISSLRTDPSFCQFYKPIHGIRALAKVLLNYRRRPGQPGVGGQGIDTVQEIISRWAPPNENNTAAYIRAVAQSVGVASNAHIDLTDRTIMLNLVKAIISHENGMQPYDNELLLSGIELAY